MVSSTTNEDFDLASDILVGAEAIAAFRGESVQRTRYLIRRRLIPFYREGSRICASRRVLREHHLAAAKAAATQ